MESEASDLLLRGGFVKMATGIEMMLKSLGFDPGKMVKDFEALKDGVVNTLQQINDRLERMETRQEEMWKMNQRALSMSSQVRLVREQPKTQPLEPPMPQTQQPEPQSEQPMQPRQLSE